MAGIIGYGAYVPLHRIKVEEIAKVWGTDAESYKKGLMLKEKSVPAPDQDTITMSVEASRYALTRAKINPSHIEAVYVGSESHPYAVKPSGTVVSEAIGSSRNTHCADFEFACKAGSEAMFVCISLVQGGAVKYGLAIGADTSQGAPGDALEYSAAAGAAAFIFGKEDGLAKVLWTHTFMTDMPDFWRREYEYYPRHGGRFTGEEAYFKHVTTAANEMMEKSGLAPKDFAFAVFHQPNGKFPMKVGELLGFKKEQMEAGWLSPTLGNTYSGSSPMGLTAILDVAKPGDKILMTSYGSGAGSDGFVFEVTKEIEKVRHVAPRTREQLDKKRYIDYGVYAKFRKKILKAG
ncbi:MAG: hydroxymethylglutaryl-CoA synthase [Candidatus Eisenbacteria bacterium]